MTASEKTRWTAPRTAAAIRLAPDLARWARAQALADGRTLSHWIEGLIERERGRLHPDPQPEPPAGEA